LEYDDVMNSHGNISIKHGFMGPNYTTR
jgi:hypothetical protein